ncbi:protein of unknown function [Rhodovastum atsumiense]|nr:protein of unknown function [Rhodovastum atsumiense]
MSPPPERPHLSPDTWAVLAAAAAVLVVVAGYVPRITW